MKKKKEQSEYSTFGRNEFRNAHTGEMQKSITIDWTPLNLGYAPSTTTTLDDEYDDIISNLPNILDLSKFNGGNMYEHELQFFNSKTYKESLYNVSYGTLLAIKEYINK